MSDVLQKYEACRDVHRREALVQDMIAEIRKLRAAVHQKVLDQTTLSDLRVDKKGIEATFEGGAIHLLADALVEQFVDGGSTNYIECSFENDKLGTFTVTMQRSEGKTPGQIASEAVTECKTLRASEKSLSDAYVRVRALVDAFQTPHAPTPDQVYEHTESRIKALIAIKDAAVNLAKVKGRHHSEIAYQRLVAALEESK